jgi:hypothetical protein
MTSCVCGDSEHEGRECPCGCTIYQGIDSEGGPLGIPNPLYEKASGDYTGQYANGRWDW